MIELTAKQTPRSRKLNKSVLHGMEIAECIRRGITTIGRASDNDNEMEENEVIKINITAAEVFLGVRCVRAFCSRCILLFSISCCYFLGRLLGRFC